MRAYLEKEGQNKVRIPLDPMQGMVLAQGHLLQHLVFAIIAMWLMEIVEPLDYYETEPIDISYSNPNNATQSDWQGEGYYIRCFTVDNGVAYFEDRLKNALGPLIYMHFYCATAQLLTQILAACTRSSYFHNFLRMASVPVYQFALFKAYYEVVKLEEYALARSCTGITFAQRRAWIYIELGAFIVNLSQLIWNLAKAHKPCGGGTCCDSRVEKFLNETYEDQMEDVLLEVRRSVAKIREMHKQQYEKKKDEKIGNKGYD